MKLRRLREDVCRANLDLVAHGLVMESFGNASGIDRDTGLVAIKPSGVPYDRLTPASLVLTNLNGRVVEGALRPSSDLPTHLVLYRAFPRVGGVVHTHSSMATVWAQAGRDIPCFGTTHADYLPGPIPVTKPMTPREIDADYEENTGHVIVRRLADVDPMQFTAVLVHGHGPFCWGETAFEAVHAAVIVEQLARLAYGTVTLNPGATPISRALQAKHFLRKHGPEAYYGQERGVRR